MAIKTHRLTPLARKVLNHLTKVGKMTPRDALLDLDVNSGSFTRRITEIKDAGYPIRVKTKSHPTTGKRYNEYTFGAHD
jgi:hypothetical protein